MNRRPKNTDFVLDSDFIDAVADSYETEAIDGHRVSRLRASVMEKIDEADTSVSLFDTIRSEEGEWIEILPNVAKKVLKRDSDSGIESYLLRMQPGASAPAHVHESDELCYVIEGDLAFGEISLKAGDYHYAHKGSQHADASTVNGTLLFLQSGIEFQDTA